MKLKHTTRKLNDFGRTLILALRKPLTMCHKFKLCKITQ